MLADMCLTTGTTGLPVEEQITTMNGIAETGTVTTDMMISLENLGAGATTTETGEAATETHVEGGEM